MFYGVIDKDYVTFESFYETTDNDILNEADASRKAILSDSCKVVNGFLRANGIHVDSHKAFRNRDFKKGKTNEIKFCFSAKFGTAFLIGLFFSILVEMLYIIYIEAKYIPMIKELFKDKKKVEELNKQLKEVGNVKVKDYNSGKNELTLVYSE